MIDIHSHILYDIDDGPEDARDTFKMLWMAKKEGITHMIATPHFRQNYNLYDHQMLMRRYNKVKDLIDEYRIPIKLYLGNEIAIDYSTVQALLRNEAKTLAGSRYVLIELPFARWTLDINKILSDIKSAGYIPIIAHAERYTQVMKHPMLLHKWRQEGYYIQINANSLCKEAGFRMRKLASRMVKEESVHFIATDCHSPFTRGPFFKEAYDRVLELGNRAMAENIFVNHQQSVLLDKHIMIK